MHPDSFACWQLNYRNKDAPSVQTTVGRNRVARTKQYRSSCHIRWTYWDYDLYLKYILERCRPRWLSWMRIRLETRRSRVRPPPRSATFFRGDWSWNIFYDHSLPSADSRRAVSGERMCTILVNRLEDKACPVNVWLGKLTALDMTPLSWLGRKTSTQTKYTWT